MGALTPTQKTAFLKTWAVSREAASKILALKKYDVAGFRAAIYAVDDAMPKFRADKMSDDQFVSLIDATIVSTGDLMLEDGTLVIDSDLPEKALIETYINSLPNYSSALTLKDDTVISVVNEPEPAWKKFVIPGAILLLAILILRRKQ